jgi:hypothetical protein
VTTKSEILRLVRAKCLDCCCFQLVEVRECPVVTCPIHDFRMGVDPKPARGRGFGRTNRSNSVRSQRNS